MKLKLILLISCIFLGLAYGYWEFFYLSRNAKLEDFSDLPEVITVRHTPNPVDAQRGGPSGLEYSWVYATSVACKGDNAIRVKEFYGFTQDEDGKWECRNVRDRTYTGQDFSEWYGCPNGILEPGKTYTCDGNWSGTSSGEQSQTLWLYIGEDSSGRRVRGQAIIIKNAFPGL